MAAHCYAEPLGDLACRRRRSAKKRNELVPARMRDQLSFTKIGAREIEDRPQYGLCVRLTKLLGQPSVVIDIGYEQRNWTTRSARLGDRCRGGVDEGVVRSEPSLLIEKNEMLLPAGRSQPWPEWLRVGGKDNRKSGGPNDARGKDAIWVI
jgi:hypothetical protein